MTDPIIQVVTAVNLKETAETIAGEVLRLRLAACAQIEGPFESHYHWRGKLERALEWRCVFKSRESLYEKLEKKIRLIHPYEIPEIVAWPVTAGLTSYLEWVKTETAQGGERPNG